MAIETNEEMAGMPSIGSTSSYCKQFSSAEEYEWRYGRRYLPILELALLMSAGGGATRQSPAERMLMSAGGAAIRRSQVAVRRGEESADVSRWLCGVAKSGGT
jgi:hypothetical protein